MYTPGIGGLGKSPSSAPGWKSMAERRLLLPQPEARLLCFRRAAVLCMVRGGYIPQVMTQPRRRDCFPSALVLCLYSTSKCGRRVSFAPVLCYSPDYFRTATLEWYSAFSPSPGDPPGRSPAAGLCGLPLSFPRTSFFRQARQAEGVKRCRCRPHSPERAWRPRQILFLRLFVYSRLRADGRTWCSSSP